MVRNMDLVFRIKYSVPVLVFGLFVVVVLLVVVDWVCFFVFRFIKNSSCWPGPAHVVGVEQDVPAGLGTRFGPA